jgi:hypothetical protein
MQASWEGLALIRFANGPASGRREFGNDTVAPMHPSATSQFPIVTFLKTRVLCVRCNMQASSNDIVLDRRTWIVDVSLDSRRLGYRAYRQRDQNFVITAAVTVISYRLICLHNFRITAKKRS